MCSQLKTGSNRNKAVGDANPYIAISRSFLAVLGRNTAASHGPKSKESKPGEKERGYPIYHLSLHLAAKPLAVRAAIPGYDHVMERLSWRASSSLFPCCLLLECFLRRTSPNCGREQIVPGEQRPASPGYFRAGSSIHQALSRRSSEVRGNPGWYRSYQVLRRGLASRQIYKFGRTECRQRSQTRPAASLPEFCCWVDHYVSCTSWQQLGRHMACTTVPLAPLPRSRGVFIIFPVVPSFHRAGLGSQSGSYLLDAC